MRTFVKGILGDMQAFVMSELAYVSIIFALCLHIQINSIQILVNSGQQHFCKLEGKIVVHSVVHIFEDLVYCFNVLGYCNCGTKAESSNMLLRGVYIAEVFEILSEGCLSH